MQAEPSEAIDAAFLRAAGRMAVAHGSARDPASPIAASLRLTGAHALQLFDSQLQSRHLDLAARQLRARGAGFYTSASSGHARG